MASHLFSRPNSAKFVLRNRLRRVLLESLERREMMAADVLGFSDLSAPVSYTIAGQAAQPLAFHSTGDLSGMSPDDVTSYLDSTLGGNSGDVSSRAWFPLIQESYSKWSQQNGLAFSYTSGLNDATAGLVAEGEAGGPRLLSIAPNSGDIFSFNNVNTLTEAPTELVFRFDGASGISPASIAGGFKIVRANRDGVFGNGNDQVITPGYLSFGDNNKIIVMRFATTLPDDLYRVMVIGADDASATPPETAVRNVSNLALDVRPFDSTPGDLTRDSIDFRLELGAQVVSVVPQPIDRLASNTVNLDQSGGSFVLQVRQGDTTDNAAGTSVSLRLVQSGTTTTAAYDKATNRITVTLAAGANVTDVVDAINNSLSANFAAVSVVNGSNAVNALDLGIRNVSLTNWSLDVKRDQIRVYFNEDDLFPTPVTTGDLTPNPTVVDPAFYQLILTSDTVQPNDDVVFTASSISYDPALNLATLTFVDPIDELAGAGTYRLRIGGRDSVANQADPKTITPVTVGAEQPGDFGGATAGPFAPVTLSASTSIVLNSTITTTSTADLRLDFPGSNFEPGHRDIQDETHINQAAGDSSPQIATQFYNFALNRPYGLDAAGRPVSTTITPEQLARVREIFEFYSMVMGIDFVESESAGLTFVVGDLFPNGGAQSGPGGVIGIAGGGLAILDGAEVWDNSFGGQSGIPGSQNFFLVAMHEIGHLLGLGHVSEQPVLTVMAGSAIPFTEWAFPGDHDIVHGQFLFRPDNRDVDSYKFTVPAGKSGTLNVETIAERLPDSSNLDTYLTLFKETPTGFEVVAVNNDSVSSDSFLSVNVTEGNYYVSVTGKGNENFNPLIQNTGDGAVSQGNYQLKVDFQEDSAAATIEDPAGSALDGDGDGLAGGNFNFWFRTAAPVGVAVPGAPKTIYVDKGFAGASIGSPAAPMNSLDLDNPVKWPTGLVQPGDIIRVVGSLGADRLLSTAGDNPAYEIGRGGVGNATLSDGIALEVPQGVTVMIDAGAIFKLGNSRISTGSLDASIDKSFSSLQVLGTPRQTVNFTSYNDQTQGTDTNPLITAPQAGDWGGIDLHNNIDRQEGRGDYERKGIFLNYLSHADIRYGGGQITVVSPSPTINPVNLSEARPTLLYNTIRFSADAAIAADPNSFEETRFTEPRYQLAQVFRPDYDRVGPDLRGNIVTNNTVNGLFVRTTTVAGGPLTTLDTAARWDDTDITFVIGENLIISGTPGGSFLETTAPDVSLVQTLDATGGTLAIGQSVLYKVTAVDRFGAQGVPSVATAAKTLTTNAVQLNNLPTAAGEFVSRMLWRSTDGGFTYRLVAELDGDTTSYTDRGADLAASLLNPNAAQVQRARPDSRLQIDPGVVVKLSGARIEVGISAQLIAEGSADRKVVFTSRSDDSYGAGGTFDTNSNGLTTNPSSGDWGGLVARHLSSISIDQALITYGGGQTSVSGGFAGFNAVEIHQADARVTNSVLAFNGSGLGGNSGATRDGRGPHDASVIYVVGSQPVIAENIIRNNGVSGTAVISVNANAMNTDNVQDRGRQTGEADRLNAGLGNSGPLVDGNLLGSNGLNGMRIRGQELTTATVWDDSDIVHILFQSEVVIPDFHTYGGLRLQSKSDESLVVKLGGGAGITATGQPLDITDRIGGSLQIMGSPGFPVVLTSLTDDSVGAGFDPNGRPLVDTDNTPGSTGTAGSWRSIRLDPYANDRNVDTTFEYEADQIQDVGTNDAPTAAQSLGALAPALNGGDENLRLGFTLHGAVASPKDLDVYSFTGTAGTPVWIDIDQTNGALDTVVELIDSAGNIIAQSNSSLLESLNPNLLFVTPDASKITPDKVQPLDQDPFAPRNSFANTTATDLYTVNPLDAGMRVILPGATGGANTYYIRVRSSNLKPGDAASNLQDTSIAKLRGGLTTGSYRLQLRLQQADETGGSTVRFADIRYATNGIEANGMPAHSPLLGQVGEQGDAPNVLATGIPSVNFPGLGNIISSDRGSMSVAGSINGVADVDLYSFSVNRNLTQGGSNTHVSTVFDIDYADGLGRPDTTLWVYRVDTAGNPTLVLIGTDSSIADDRSAPEQGSDLDALSRGSVGARDPFIGAAELPAGNYVVAVSNNSRMAVAMQQYQTAAAANPLIRLEPVNSVNRLFVDRVGGTSADTAAAAPVLFTTAAGNGGVSANNSVPWTLADMTTYVVRNNGTGSQLVFGNAMTGVQEAEISNFVRMNDTAMSPDGRLVGYEINVTAASQTDANSGNFHLINSIGAPGNAATPNGASTNIGNTGIQTFTTQRTDNNAATPTFAIQQRDQNGPNIGGNTPQGDGFQINGLTFFTQSDNSTTLQMFGVGSRGNGVLTYNQAIVDANGAVTGIGPAVANTTNYVYKLDPTTGAAINPTGVADRTGANIVNSGGAGTNKVEFGRFISTGTVTGLAEIGGRLFAVSDLGEFFAANNATTGNSAFGNVNPSAVIVDNVGNPIQFTSLTAGPRNLEGGRFANMLFGTTANGTIWAFSTTGVKQPIFPGFSASVKSNSAPLNTTGSVQGIDFSPLDVNLWHTTNRRADDAGHGRTVPFDLSQTSDLNGGTSLYFGYEANRQAGTWQGVYNVAAFEGTYNMPGGASGAIVSNPIDLRGYSADDLPMLYFNYFLATENANSDLQDNDIRMRDAFRVYAAGEDGTWILLTTNNSDQGGANRNSAVDEFDTAANLNVDPFGNPLFTQETFDNTGAWRQARTSLAALAGQQNVRLRFEFSTGASFRNGDPQLGGVDLIAVAGAKLNDGETFTVTPIDGVSPLGSQTFELDMGLVLDLPGGASITSGVSQLVISITTITFSLTDNTGNNIQYVATDSPAQIATKVRNRLPAILDIPAAAITVNSLRGNTLNVAGLPAAEVYGSTGLPASVLAGVPGVNTVGNVAVLINQSMTELQVRDAIRAQLAATFNSTNDAATPNASALQAWQIHNSTLRLFKYDVVNNSGLGLTGGRNGDVFGVQGSNGNRMDERAQENTAEGIYIDDIIVGFAERGEMVFNSTAADALPSFVANGDYSGLGSTFNVAQIEQGAYQLTVRTAAEYGVQDGARIQLGRSFDTNVRLAEQVAIQVSPTSAGALRDGITFTLSDGFNLATFEFDVTGGAGDVATGVVAGNIRVPIAANATPTEIATAIRDAINSSTAQLILKLTASLQGEMTYGLLFGDVADSGSARVLLHGDAAALRNGNLTFANTPLLTFVRSGTESPMFHPQGLAFGEDLGDVERQREQGQILLVGNTITNSSGFGILNDAGARNQSAIGAGVGPRPYPGSPIQTPTLNQSNLAPGVVIMNNILANNTAGGVRISGDSDNTGMAVPSLIARVINNTVFGGTDGILVDQGASPTILNNIVANTTNGIRNVGATVVLGANLFQNNTNHTVGTTTGSFPEILAAGDPLFVTSTIANRRFYLAAGSKAIDSSLEALQERPELTQVKNSIGLPLSPMLAPDLDVTGQRRVDDPTVNSPAGLGGNVFKDRGAVDRSDFLGLNAIILQPQDNDSAFADSDRNTTFIQLSEGELEFFSLLLQDINGTGPDETSVNAAGAVSLTENGRLLIPDVDYVFGYNANSRTIRLTPIAGIWRKDSVYEISLNNKPGIRLTVGTGVADGNRYTITHSGGSTVFEFDTGSPAGVSPGAVRVPIQSGFTPYQMAAQLVAAINGSGIGLTSYLQGDGTLMVNEATAITATGAALGTPLPVAAIRDLAGNPLNANRASSLTQFTIVMPEVTVDYGDIDGIRVPTIKLPNSVVAPVVSNGDGARHALLPIDIPLLVLGDFADADNDGAPSPSASGDDSETLFSLGTLASIGATLTNSGAATVDFNLNLADIDGQQFTISDTVAHPLTPVVFEFTTGPTTGSPTVVQIVGGDTSQSVAIKIAVAVEAVLKLGRLDNIIPVVDPVASNRIRLVANDGYLFDFAAAPSLTRLASGNVEITLPATIANLDGTQFSFTDGNGNTVNFELNLFDPALPIPGVSANHVAINIPSTVALPTTPEDVATAIAAAINTQLNMRNLLRSLATATGSTISILADDEDGVTFEGVFNSASNPVTVTAVSSGAGMLDAWMDWNGDGDFDDANEQFIVNQPVQAGANNFTVTTPANAVPGFVTARFRLSTLGSTLPGGVAIGGEVEDYLVEIVEGAPPVAVSDAYIVDEDNVLTVSTFETGVLGNDTDPNNDPLAIPPIVEPIFVFDEDPTTPEIEPLVDVDNGTLVLNANGTFTYTPDPDFNGTDQFVYNAVDTRLKSNLPTTVTITVRPINDAPLGVDDTIDVIEDEIVIRSGATFTANDLAHAGIGTSPNASNESGQLLQIINAAIISETTTDFGGIAGLNVRIAAKPGQGEYGIRVYVNSIDLGPGMAPTVSVVASTITVTLNSHAGSVSTVDDFIAAIDGDALASTLVSLTLTGSGATPIGDVATAYSPVVVPPSGGSFSVAGNELTYTPPAHYNSVIGGPALLLLTIEDDATAGPTANLTSTSTLTINIAAVNDRPQFDAWPADQEVITTEDIGLVTIPNFVTGLIPGPVAAADEASGPTLGNPEDQSITFTSLPAEPLLVEALNPALFAVQPTLTVVGNSATLSFELAQDVNKEAPFGPILVRVTAQDSGNVGGPNNDLNQSITRTFTILPAQVNDAPVFDLPAPPIGSAIPIVVSEEDQGEVIVPGFMTNQFPARSTALDELDPAANPAQLPMRVEIVADPNVFVAADPLNGIPSGLPTIDPITGDLRYQTRKDINRTMPGLNFNIEVTLIDAAGTPGVDRTTKTFAIDVTAYNDAPEFVMPLATSAFVEDPNANPGDLTTVPNFVTAILPGPLTAIDEGFMGGLGENQQVRFLVEAIDATGAVDNSLFDTAPGSLPYITGTDEPNPGTLTYRLRQDINQITPFPQILVRVIAIDTGAPSPAIVQFDPLNTTPRDVNASASRTFTILPDPINDAPIFTFNPAVLDPTKPAVPTINASEDDGTVTVVDFLLDVLPGPVTALDELGNQQIITPILVEALDPSAFDGPTGQPQLVLDPLTNRATLTYRTAPNVNDNTGHSLFVRITVQDDGGVINPGDDDTTIATFSISVAPVNDVPSFTLPIVAPAVTPSVRVNEDNGLTTLPFATSILAGPASALDENLITFWKQTLFFDVLSNTNTALFSTQPSIDPVTGNLTFQPAPEQNGQAVVVVQLRDQTNDGTPSLSSGPQTFTINITSINDAPEFTPGAAYVDSSGNWVSNSIEDQGVVVRPNFAINLRVGPVLATDEAAQPQQLTVHVRALDPTAFIDQPAVDASGTLTYRTALDVNSNQSSHDLRVEIFLTDDGITGPAPHSNMSVVRTFTIAAAPINDAPVFSLTSSQVDVIEDVEQATGQSPTTIDNFAFNIRQAIGLLSDPQTATDEVTQELRFDVISVSAPELFLQNANPALDGQPRISATTGQLTFHTAPHKNGKAVIVVRLVEPFAASSPAPNSNTSATQTFTISISAINDAPQFDIPGSITYAEDAGLISQNSFATNVRRGPVGSEDENSQEIRFIVTALDPSAFAVQPSIGVDGTLTFQTAPNANALNADLRVQVQLMDFGADSPAPNTNLSVIKTFVINATPVNDPPIPDSFFLDSDEDARITIQASAVLANDEPGPTDDEDGQQLRMTQVERTTAGGGTVIPTFDANNNIVSFEYIPPANFVGPDTFLYVVTDNGVPARSGTGTITIGLRGVNDPPQFLRGADQIAPEDSPLISLPGWATEILPGPPAALDELLTQTVTFNVESNNASLFEVQPSVSNDGTLQFKPRLNANGVAIVTVIAVDDGAIVAESVPQVFTINISAVNDAPVFTPGPSVTVDEDSGAYSEPWASGVLPAAGLLTNPPTATDEDTQGVDFTVVADKPSLFSVQPTVSSSGQLQFTPNRDAFGVALITIRAVDRGPSGALDVNTSAAHTLTITINQVNDEPVAVTDSFNTNENVIFTLGAPGLLANDTDVDLPNDQLAAVPAVIKSAAGADVRINADGSIVYDPSLVAAIQQLTTGQNIQDTFVYRIVDSSGDESIPATVTINVAGVNDAPTAVNDSYSVGVGQSQFLDVLSNDVDVDSSIDAASISISSLPAFGTVVVNQTGVIQYTPGGGFRGVDTFRYTVRDTAGNVSNEAIVTVTVNNRPTANDDVAFTYKNESVDIDVLANDTDLDGNLNAGSVEIVLLPSPSGTATVLANGTIRFTPTTDFVGLVTLSYVVRDDIGTVSNVADVDIRVQRSKWQNPRLALDVNADTFISPIDALLIINKLNDPTFQRNLPLGSFVAPPYLDTNGDEQVSPLDALLVINHLNATRGSSGEGEGATYAMMVTPQDMIATVGTKVVQDVQTALAETFESDASELANTISASSSFATWSGNDDDEAIEGLFCSSDEEHSSTTDAIDGFFESIGPYLPE